MGKKQEFKYHIVNESGVIVGSFNHEYDRDHFLSLYNRSKHNEMEKMSTKDDE